MSLLAYNRQTRYKQVTNQSPDRSVKTFVLCALCTACMEKKILSRMVTNALMARDPGSFSSNLVRNNSVSMIIICDRV